MIPLTHAQLVVDVLLSRPEQSIATTLEQSA
jgi:hypothetical protein